MFGFGFQELFLVFLLAIFLFGAKKLPEIGAGLGKGIRSFRQGLKDMEKDEEIAEKKEIEEPLKREKEEKKSD